MLDQIILNGVVLSARKLYGDKTATSSKAGMTRSIAALRNASGHPSTQESSKRGADATRRIFKQKYGSK